MYVRRSLDGSGQERAPQKECPLLSLDEDRGLLIFLGSMQKFVRECE